VKLKGIKLVEKPESSDPADRKAEGLELKLAEATP